MQSMQEHYPVMAGEVIEYLAVRPEGTYADCSTGLGGHARRIAGLLTTGRLICLDRDAESLEKARLQLAEFGDRIAFRQSLFSQLRQTLASLGVEKVDGMVADLGVSRYQLTDPDRGFSLMVDGPLDMRMGRGEGPTAADIVNFSSENQIADIIYTYGEERRARKLARAIVRTRPHRTTLALARVIEEAAPRTGKLHPATRTFMALRMAVNRELEELEALLDQASEALATGGRIVMLTFHSLEARIVKTRFQQWARDGRASLLTKHVVRPQQEEVRRNPASRSAMLRAAQIEEPQSTRDGEK
ncbi:MAG: 16S rRNA (cytosine(1402)-N(4))-methyltransferase RsmH [Acidimicrobiia bacterium]|nr:16S rRNA (cytosine(1402)-N(4))-methyltransferase RsmH [Acidimicrobiia bacterium]